MSGVNLLLDKSVQGGPLFLYVVLIALLVTIHTRIAHHAALMALSLIRYGECAPDSWITISLAYRVRFLPEYSLMQCMVLIP